MKACKELLGNNVFFLFFPDGLKKWEIWAGGMMNPYNGNTSKTEAERIRVQGEMCYVDSTLPQTKQTKQ